MVNLCLFVLLFTLKILVIMFSIDVSVCLMGCVSKDNRRHTKSDFMAYVFTGPVRIEPAEPVVRLSDPNTREWVRFNDYS